MRKKDLIRKIHELEHICKHFEKRAPVYEFIIRNGKDGIVMSSIFARQGFHRKERYITFISKDYNLCDYMIGGCSEFSIMKHHDDYVLIYEPATLVNGEIRFLYEIDLTTHVLEPLKVKNSKLTQVYKVDRIRGKLDRVDLDLYLKVYPTKGAIHGTNKD